MCSFIEHPGTFLLLAIALLGFALLVELTAAPRGGGPTMTCLDPVASVATPGVAPACPHH